MKSADSFAAGADGRRESVAIIGIGCRFPGAADASAFWSLLRDGVEAVGEYPEGRSKELDDFYDSVGSENGPTTRRGGFLSDLDRFDAGFFGISPREAEYLDPQQRLLHEVAWEALEDAGQVREKYAGSRTGVFVGVWLNDYETLVNAGSPVAEFLATTGGGTYAASGRLAYTFDLRGPNLTLNTACSSSLVAIQLACEALRAGKCGMALAGGANTILRPEITQAYARSGMLSADGRCKFGDERADGYVRSEGAGLIVLKLVSAAERDGDRIYAVIRGGAVNNDGKSGELLVMPSRRGQEDMLRAAYQDAGISPAEVQYVEAHGTGTSVGDPIEISALANVVGGEGRQTPCWIGSCKSNIGHTESAAGVASVIKVALSLHHDFLPATLHVINPTDAVQWEGGPVRLQVPATRWPESTGRRIAGVSGFGITGTNAHLVLEGRSAVSGKGKVARSPHLLAIAAKTSPALKALAQSYLERCQDQPLNDICFTAANRRTHLDHRLAVVAKDLQEVGEGIRAFLLGEERANVAVGDTLGETAPKVAFIFPGQGSQWAGMGRELFHSEPVFRDAIVECDDQIQREAGWSLIAHLTGAEPDSRMARVDVIQPVLFAIEVALAKLWRSWGVEPAAVVGHSMGEVAAAHIAGSLSLADAVRVICRRSSLLLRTSGKGAMALVELSVAEAEAAIHGREDRISVAVSNSPRSTVISGDPGALALVLRELEERQVFCRYVKVDVASHSPQMDPLAGELLEALQAVSPVAGSIPIYSPVLSEVTDGSGYDASYWVANLRRPVLFCDVIQRLLEEGFNTFIEISPQPILVPSIEQVLAHTGNAGRVVGSLRRNEPERAALLAALARLFVAGQAVHWADVCPPGATVGLPCYPWERERFWFTPRAGRARQLSGASAHPLLGQPIHTATGDWVWTAEISLEAAPWLGDHAAGGITMLPASAYVEMAASGARQIPGARDGALEELSLKEAVAFQSSSVTRLQMLFSSESNRRWPVKFYSQSEGSAEWVLAATGVFGGEQSLASLEGGDPVRFSGGAPVDRTASRSEHSKAMARLGYGFGPSFQCVEWCSEASGRSNAKGAGEGIEALAEVRLPDGLDASGYLIHPALIDAGFQVLAGLIARHGEPCASLLPISTATVKIMGPLAGARSLLIRAILFDPGQPSGAVFFYDPTGAPVAAVSNLTFRAFEGASLDRYFHTIEWEPAERAAGTAKPGPGSWLILADHSGIGRQLATELGNRGDVCRLIYLADVLSGEHLDDEATTRQALQQIVNAAFGRSMRVKGVLYLWTLDIEENESPAQAERDCLRIAQLVQALIEREAEARVWLVTRGACATSPAMGVAILQAPAWGLGAVIANEHPELRCTCIDLPPVKGAGDSAALLEEIIADTADDRIALRGANRLVARLKPFRPVARSEAMPRRLIRSGDGFALRLGTTGLLDTFDLWASQRTNPGDGEVEIEICSAGLNFVDVMKVMGLDESAETPHPAIGAECAGKITRVGGGVTGFKPGDPVIAVTPSFRATSLFVSHAVVPAELTWHKPETLSFEQAAALPCAYLTAYYGLIKLAGLSAGERVLIHSASGGVGLAAIQIARWVGAEIFATAGSDEKREYLRRRGIEHVMDSRSVAFADEIMRVTEGRGVDVVLNSLDGAAIPAGLRILSPYGRFVEIGKRDIWRNSPIGLAPFGKNVSFFGVDLAKMAEDRRSLVRAMFEEIVELLWSGATAPLPVRSFPISQAADGFRDMAQGKHVGKIVFDFEGVESVAEDRVAVRSDCTYLITGGLGGLGLATAQELAKSGARHLALVGRGGRSARSAEAIAQLESGGVQVTVFQADLSRERDVRELLHAIENKMPALRGIVHAAGVLDDALVVNLSGSHFLTAMAGKAHGALLLDRLTAQTPLDFFVLFSSIAGVLGSPGQGNYAAANALLDALAHDRAARGLPATSIDWGPWSGVGLAAAQSNRGQRIATQGLESLSPRQGQALLRAVLERGGPAQIGAVDLDAEQWRRSVTGAARSGLFAGLSKADQPTAAGPPGTAFLDELRAAKPGEACALLEAHIRGQVAAVLKLSASRIPLNTALRHSGLDSLMGLELRNRLERSLRVKLSASLIWNYPTILAIAEYLAGKLNLSGVKPAVFVSTEAGTELVSAGEQSVSDLLAAELEGAESLLGKS